MSSGIPPRAWALLGLLALIWGASFLATRVMLEELPVMTAVSFRVTGAAAAMWLWVWARGIPLPPFRALWGFPLMGLFHAALPWWLINWGQQHIESGLAAILNATTALFGFAFAALAFRDERLTPRKALGVALGFVGVSTAIGLHNLQAFDITSLAQLAIIGAGACYGIAGVVTKLATRGVRAEASSALTLSFAALMIVPLALTQDGAPSFDYRAATWLAIGYSALLASALAYLLYYVVLGLAGAGNVSLVTLMVPVVAIVLGAVTYGERLEPAAFAGFGLIGLGLLLLNGPRAPRVSPLAKSGAAD